MLLTDATVGWLLFGSLLLAIGALGGRWVLLTERAVPDPELRRRLRSSAARLGFASSLALVIALFLVLARQLVEIRDTFVPLQDDVRMLAGTSWGTSWSIALVAAVVAIVGFGVARRGNRMAWWIASLGVLVLSAFPARIGHANGHETWRSFAIVADATHVLAGGAWIGGLALIVLLCWPRAAQPEPTPSLLAQLVPAFSRLAKVAVAGLVITGTYAAWRILPSISALWATGYGRLFALKVALFLVVLAFGARNLKKLTPRLGTETGDRAMTRSILLELAVANAVLVATALLVRSSPEMY